MKKFNFTIVELLVVIAIIGILMGLLFPAISKVKENARKTRAKAEMNSIVTAIKSYETTYGYLPLCGITAIGSSANGDVTTAYRRLIELLTCVDGPDSGTTITSNARGVRFLDVPSNYGIDANTVAGTKTNATVGDFKDPWGNLYQIYLDANYDGKINSSDSGANLSSGAVGGGTDLNGTVLIYSLGPNGINDARKNTQFGEGAGKDDVCSWR